jgi:integrase
VRTFPRKAATDVPVLHWCSSEATHLQLQDLDLDRRHVQFIDTKNGTNRGVPLHPLLVETVRAMLSVHRPNGGDVSGVRMANSILSTRGQATGSRLCLSGRAKRAGITKFRIHDTRHTWATWHYQANRDLGALQKLGGWKTMEMVMLYAHTNVAELSDTIERL